MSSSCSGEEKLSGISSLNIVFISLVLSTCLDCTPCWFLWVTFFSYVCGFSWLFSLSWVGKWDKLYPVAVVFPPGWEQLVTVWCPKQCLGTLFSSHGSAFPNWAAKGSPGSCCWQLLLWNAYLWSFCRDLQQPTWPGVLAATAVAWTLLVTISASRPVWPWRKVMDPVVEICWSVDQADSWTGEVVGRLIKYPCSLCFPNCNKPLIPMWFLVHHLTRKVPKGKFHSSLYSILWQDFIEPLSPWNAFS